MKNDLKTRRDTYYKLNTHLAHVDNEQLNSLFGYREKTHSWGTNHTIKLGKSKVFVKKIPVTEVEYNHMFSTKNLYRLPTYYNYGVDSAGFGIFRELVAHIKTTNWVLEGSIENFPLMYHYRIVPCSGQNPGIDIERHKGYVKYWNSNKNIGKYIIDRTNAKYEAVLFLEYIPYTLWAWFGKNIDQLDRVISEMRNTITFLRKNGIIHFDVHFANIVTDGEKPYLTDFGLVLDRRFDLSERERSFFRKNTHYDYGEFLCGIGDLILSIYKELADTKKKKIMRKYGVEDGMQHHELRVILLENIGEIYADSIMKLDKNYVDTVIKYRDIIILMEAFFADMLRNNKKDTKYNHTKLRRLLEETEFLPGRTF